MTRRLLCLFGAHHMIWFSTSDGGRWKHCSRCGSDWSGSGMPSWQYGGGGGDAQGRMGF